MGVVTNIRLGMLLNPFRILIFSVRLPRVTLASLALPWASIFNPVGIVTPPVPAPVVLCLHPYDSAPENRDISGYLAPPTTGQGSV